MLKHLTYLGVNLRLWGCDNDACQSIEAIQANSAQRMLLISSGYIYADSSLALSQELAKVQAENNYLHAAVSAQPQNLAGFAGINPLRPYALDEIKRCVEQLHLAGIKMHFQNNTIDITQAETRQKLQPVFQYLASNNVPVLIHNNAWNRDTGSLQAEAYIQHYLTKMPLTIIFAHMGGGGFFTRFNQDFIETFVQLRAQNALQGKAYFDLSAIVFDRAHNAQLPIQQQLRLLRAIGFEHLLFGTDYPVSNLKEYKQRITNEWPLSKAELTQLFDKAELFNHLITPQK